MVRNMATRRREASQQLLDVSNRSLSNAALLDAKLRVICADHPYSTARKNCLQHTISVTNYTLSHMKSNLSAMVFSCVMLASGCAIYEPVSKEYTGPIATLRDTGISESESKAQIFAALEIDGNQIINAFGASAYASQGRGNNLITMFPERKVKAVPMKVKLHGSHATGAPIAAIASQVAGTFYSVEGVVDFSPKPGGKYIVRGELRKEKSTVWIEDVETGEPVSVVVTK